MTSATDAGVGVTDITYDDAMTAGATNYVVLSTGATHVTSDQAATTTTTVRINNRNNCHDSEDAGDVYVAILGAI